MRPYLYSFYKQYNYLKLFINLFASLKRFDTNILFYFCRKIKIFNKSRYSRNRQTARVIFYFSLYFNIFIIYVVFMVMYGFVFKLTKLWWLFIIFILSFFLPSFLRIINSY